MKMAAASGTPSSRFLSRREQCQLNTLSHPNFPLGCGVALADHPVTETLAAGLRGADVTGFPTRLNSQMNVREFPISTGQHAAGIRNGGYDMPTQLAGIRIERVTPPVRQSITESSFRSFDADRRTDIDGLNGSHDFGNIWWLRAHSSAEYFDYRFVFHGVEIFSFSIEMSGEVCGEFHPDNAGFEFAEPEDFSQPMSMFAMPVGSASPSVITPDGSRVSNHAMTIVHHDLELIIDRIEDNLAADLEGRRNPNVTLNFPLVGFIGLLIPIRVDIPCSCLSGDIFGIDGQRLEDALDQAIGVGQSNGLCFHFSEWFISPRCRRGGSSSVATNRESSPKIVLSTQNLKRCKNISYGKNDQL